MLRKMLFSLLLFASIVVGQLGCEKNEVDTLKVDTDKIEFQKAGGVSIVNIETNAGNWNISNPTDWIVLSNASGSGPTAIVTISVTTKTITSRIDTLTITAGSAAPVKIVVSQPSSEYLYSISFDVEELNFGKESTSLPVKVTTDAPLWTISSDVDWLHFSATTGGAGETTIDVTAPLFDEEDWRTATIEISAQYTENVQLSALQKGDLYPSYNSSPIAADASGMSSTAVELAAKMIPGWNIGNTLEAIGGETAWGNPEITKSHIQYLKQTGFKAVRLPCSWNQYADQTTAEINLTWLDRVKEVVQYCVDEDLYVLLNIHWDGGWLENNCTPDKQDENNSKQRAFWQQIATHLRDFDEHLLFAGANEPNVEDAEQMEVLMSYYRTFIDAVRSTGGKNTHRALVLSGPSTDVEKTNKLMTSLPTDNIANKMMVEVHYYTPYQFCLMEEDASWGKTFYYWGAGNHSATDTERNADWGEESTVDEMMALMNTQFVSNGIPVILGEYSAMTRELTGDALDLHLASRAYYFKYVTKKAIENGLIPFFWDTGSMLDRRNNTVLDQLGLNGLLEGAAK